jgi:hypothetical protein
MMGPAYPKIVEGMPKPPAPPIVFVIEDDPLIRLILDLRVTEGLKPCLIQLQPKS